MREMAISCDFPELLEMASEYGETLAETPNSAAFFLKLKADLLGCDVAFAVLNNPEGADFVLIKSKDLLEEIANSGVARDLETLAIPCRDLEMALALLNALSTDDRVH
jgi:hypothetical protein